MKRIRLEKYLHFFSYCSVFMRILTWSLSQKVETIYSINMGKLAKSLGSKAFGVQLVQETGRGASNLYEDIYIIGC